MRKIVIILMAALIAAVAFAGCSKASDATGEWSIGIVDIDGTAIDITNRDISSISMVEIEADLEKKDGRKINQNWKGIRVKDLLKEAGIREYKTISIEAQDGYSEEFDFKTINDEGTIIGFTKNGKKPTEDNGIPRLVVKTMAGSAWLKNIAKIKVIE